MTASNPRAVGISAAARTSRELAVLFGKLGTAEHPRGAILRAYRNAHRGLRDVFGRRGTGLLAAFEAREVFAALRRDVQITASETLLAASETGNRQAATEAEAWGLPSPITVPVVDQNHVSAWLSVLDDQTTRSGSVIATGGDPVVVLGDESRAGILQPAPVVREGATWITTAALVAWSLAVDSSTVAQRTRFDKQAVAAIDERTTQTCLLVHGQIQPVDSKFSLRGTPRFADELPAPPFHWFCRTAMVLVLAGEGDDAITRQMRDVSGAELDARAAEQARIAEIKQELAALGAQPDARRRDGDTMAVTELRDELRGLRSRPEIHPASAVGGR